MAKTTKEVGEAQDPKLKSAFITRYVKKYDCLPPMEVFGGQRVWEQIHIDAFREHYGDMMLGKRCKECGCLKDAQPAEILATDEPTPADGAA